MFCTKCGSGVGASDLFCEKCGAKLKDEESKAAAVPPATTNRQNFVTPSSSYNQVKKKHKTYAGWNLLLILLGAVLLIVGANYPQVELLFILAIAPTVFLLWYFHHADKYKQEPKKLLIVTFLLGSAAVFVAIILETLLGLVIPNGPDFFSSFLYFLIAIGLVEESLKFFSVRVYAYRSRLFDEPMDGIVLGVAAALGFATVENILYVFQYGIATALVRAVISVPGHALWGAITGFYLGEAKVHHNSSLALRGLAIAVFFHGVFDTVSSVIPNGLISLILLGVFIAFIYLKIVKKEIVEAERESPYRRIG